MQKLSIAPKFCKIRIRVVALHQNLKNYLSVTSDGTKIVKLKQVLKNTRKIVSLLASPYFSRSLYSTHLLQYYY